MAQKTSAKFLSPMAFIAFVRSVLQREAILHEKVIYFEKLEKTKKGQSIWVDAIAPNGYGETSQPVFFEIKGKKPRSDTEISNAIEKLNGIETNNQPQIVIIVNDWCEEKEGKSLNVQYSIRSLKTIEKWKNKYPIEYCNAYNIKEVDYTVKLPTILDEEFDKNNIVYLKIIENTIKEHDGFSMVLGAGVSMSQGAKNWENLLGDFKQDISNHGWLDDSESVFKMVGGTSLTTAQIYKDICANEKKFAWEIHKSLYDDESGIDLTSELGEIATLVSICQNERNFRILTYNYDDFLERYFQNIGVKYNALFSSKERYVDGKKSTELYNMVGQTDDDLRIYHVHGFLPKVRCQGDMDQTHIRSICLTEADYHMLYNQPYSWPIVSQLSFFRENTCLFIGCSLSDPNIRRLLEITAGTPPRHFSIQEKRNLSAKDQGQITSHFYRMGVNIIWVNDYNEIPNMIRELRIAIQNSRGMI